MRRAAASGALLLTTLLVSACAQRIDVVQGRDAADHAKKHIDTFAAAELLGDEAGGRGEAVAIDYVKKYFDSLGLETRLRTVPLVRMTPISTFAQVTGPNGAPLPLEPTNGKDYLIWAGQQTEQVAVKAGAVFAGYGIISPEYGRDDYKGVDVKGKVVFVLEGSPHTADRDELGALGEAYYGRRFYKFAEGFRQGAVAVLIIHGELQPWEDMETQSSGEIIDIAADASAGPTKAAVEGWLARPAAQRLFDAVKMDYDRLYRLSRELSFQPVALPGINIEIKLTSSITRTVTRDVVAVLRGQIPEYVMLSSQWNGLPFVPDLPPVRPTTMAEPTEVLGTDLTREMARAARRAEQTPNSKISGLSSDGSGAAVVMETARRIVAQRRQPLRNIVFTISTCLKPGVVSLQYYVDHPIFPLTKTVGQIFVDQASPTDAKQGVGKIGTSADDALTQMMRTAAIEQGRLVVLDQNAERRFYYKYSQAAFAGHGVPSIYITTPPETIRRLQTGAPPLPPQSRANTPAAETDPDLDAVLLTTLVRRVADTTNWRPTAMSATALLAASAR